MDTNSNKLVLLHWIGRFGNRMFQYAFGCSYAKRYNCIFYIPSEWEGSIIFKQNNYCRLITDEMLSTDINNPSATDEMRKTSLANYNDRTGDAVEYVSFQNKHAVGKVNVAFADLHCMYYQYLFDIFDEELIKEIYTFNDAVLQSEMYQWFYANKNAAQTVCHLRRGDIAELNFIGSHSMISKESYLNQLYMLGIGALDVIWISESEQERSDNVWNDKSRGHNWSYPKGESYCPEIFLDFLPDFLSMVFANTLLRGNSSLSWWAAFLSSAEIYSPVINPKPQDSINKYYCCECEFVKGNAPHFMGSKLDSDAFNDIIIPAKINNQVESCYLKYVKFINIQPQSQKKIISFSLYGTTSQYSNSRGFYKGIYVNYHLAKKLYPGWIVRVYMPFDEPVHIIDELSQITDIELILLETNICLRALRFLPHDDENVSVWLSRDLDSILNEREQVAVSDWLTNYSTKELHIMTDNVHHYWTIAGGMFGIHNDVKRNRLSGSSSKLIDFIMNFSNEVSNVNDYAVDCVICEHFFFKEDNYIQHYGSGKLLEHSKPFPPHSPIDYDFVGCVVDINSYYGALNIVHHYPLLRNKKPMTLANNDSFYYPPWNANCVVHWYSETDFTLTPIQTNKSMSSEISCLKTENGLGIKMLTSDITISVLWDGEEQKHAYILDENTIAVIHGIEHYYFTRVV